tara:strand:+ start:437 stop:604 length:168 start_codon:yes stop_codon:yes gene_type:complete
VSRLYIDKINNKKNINKNAPEMPKILKNKKCAKTAKNINKLDASAISISLFSLVF